MKHQPLLTNKTAFNYDSLKYDGQFSQVDICPKSENLTLNGCFLSGVGGLDGGGFGYIRQEHFENSKHFRRHGLLDSKWYQLLSRFFIFYLVTEQM